MIGFYIRILKAALASMRDSKIQVGEESVFHFRAWPAESEGLSSMNGTRIINAAEVSAHYNNMRNGFFRCALKHSLWAVTRQYNVRYFKSVQVMKSTVIKSRLCYWNENGVVWHHQIKQGEKLCAEIFANVRILGKKGKVSPFEAQKLMGIQVASPPIPAAVKKAFGESLQE